jgi:hypothetical protein
MRRPVDLLFGVNLRPKFRAQVWLGCLVIFFEKGL